MYGEATIVANSDNTSGMSILANNNNSSGMLGTGAIVVADTINTLGVFMYGGVIVVADNNNSSSGMLKYGETILVDFREATPGRH